MTDVEPEDPDPTVRMSLSMPQSLRDQITAIGEAEMRNPANMALVLLHEAVQVRTAPPKPRPHRAIRPVSDPSSVAE